MKPTPDQLTLLKNEFPIVWENSEQCIGPQGFLERFIGSSDSGKDTADASKLYEALKESIEKEARRFDGFEERLLDQLVGEEDLLGPLRRPRGELLHSAALAWLLTPERGESTVQHAKWRLFNSFLELVWPAVSKCNAAYDVGNRREGFEKAIKGLHCIVERSFRRDKKREARKAGGHGRVDVWLESDNMICAIEVKTQAKESPGQLLEYMGFVKKRGRESGKKYLLLVFLTPASCKRDFDRDRSDAPLEVAFIHLRMQTLLAKWLVVAGELEGDCPLFLKLYLRSLAKMLGVLPSGTHREMELRERRRIVHQLVKEYDYSIASDPLTTPTGSDMAKVSKVFAGLAENPRLMWAVYECGGGDARKPGIPAELAGVNLEDALLSDVLAAADHLALQLAQLFRELHARVVARSKEQGSPLKHLTLASDHDDKDNRPEIESWLGYSRYSLEGVPDDCWLSWVGFWMVGDDGTSKVTKGGRSYKLYACIEVAEGESVPDDMESRLRKLLHCAGGKPILGDNDELLSKGVKLAAGESMRDIAKDAVDQLEGLLRAVCVEQLVSKSGRKRQGHKKASKRVKKPAH